MTLKRNSTTSPVSGSFTNVDALVALSTNTWLTLPSRDLNSISTLDNSFSDNFAIRAISFA